MYMTPYLLRPWQGVWHCYPCYSSWKLNHGVQGFVLKCLKNYLSNRSQYVSYKNATPKLAIIKCGLQQSSILGPHLFLIYIDDLSQVCKITTPFLFAADSNLFLSSNDPHVIQDTVNKELTYIAEWLKANKLSLSIKKYNNRNKPHPSIHIEIDNQTIIYNVYHQNEIIGVKFGDVFQTPVRNL